MKKALFLTLIGLSNFYAFGQYPTSWSVTTPNTSNPGFIGIGVKPLSSSPNTADFNLQVHGTVDYTVTNSSSSSSMNLWAPTQYVPNCLNNCTSS